jgi:hypothetical protein
VARKVFASEISLSVELFWVGAFSCFFLHEPDFPRAIPAAGFRQSLPGAGACNSGSGVRNRTQRTVVRPLLLFDLRFVRFHGCE